MGNTFFDFLKYWQKRFKKNLNRNMDILISNLLSESIFDFGKWSNWKYANTGICIFSVWPHPKVKNWFQKQIWNKNVHIFNLNFFSGAFLSVFKKVKKNDFFLYFQKVMLLWQGSIVEIDYGFFEVFGPYFIGKSLNTFKILIFGLWSFIPHPYLKLDGAA